MKLPTAKSRYLNPEIPLHVVLGEASHACKLVFLGPGGNWSTQLHMQQFSQLGGKNVHFLEGGGLVS